MSADRGSPTAITSGAEAFTISLPFTSITPDSGPQYAVDRGKAAAISAVAIVVARAVDRAVAVWTFTAAVGVAWISAAVDPGIVAKFVMR